MFPLSVLFPRIENVAALVAAAPRFNAELPKMCDPVTVPASKLKMPLEVMFMEPVNVPVLELVSVPLLTLSVRVLATLMMPLLANVGVVPDWLTVRSPPVTLIVPELM